MSALAQTPASAVVFYVGQIMHARLRPFMHRFAYRVFSILIDLDQLAEADRQSRLFSVGRFNLLSFDPRDHGPRDGTDLRRHVDQLLAAEGIDLTGGRVTLLCYPRVLGRVFNPLAVYYCNDRDGVLQALIYEVRNTFGGLYPYVVPVRPAQRNGSEVRQAQDKTFYVSPFLDMNMRYQFRVRQPDDTFMVRILETDPDGPIFAAAMKGVREPLTNASVLRNFMTMPLLTLKVLGAIHWQALKLWTKGAKYHSEPEHHAGRP